MTHIHIPDGVLPFWLWGGGWIVAAILVWVLGRLGGRDDLARNVPLLGVVSALVLVAMSVEIVPLAYHLNLTVVAGVLLGPLLGLLSAFIVSTVLALLGHGGVTVIGLNTLILGTEMAIGWVLFRGSMRIMRRKRIRTVGALTTVITLACTTGLLVGIVALAGADHVERPTGALDATGLTIEDPFSEGVVSFGLAEEDEHAHTHDDEEASSLSVSRFATIVFTLGPIGWLLEAVITGAILGYLARLRPGMLFPVEDHSSKRIGGDKQGLA